MTKLSTEQTVSFPVVGIGASAGGIDALEEFFSELSDPSGMAFVVVIHSDPTHQSALNQILQRCTKMPVRRVDAKMTLEPGQVYVAPSDAVLAISDGALELEDLDAGESRWSRINQFFRSLAVECREQAVGVVLSGTGDDGTVGLGEIKAHGGMTFAQDPDEAKYRSMPASAARADYVDVVLPVRELAREFVDAWEQRDRIEKSTGSDDLGGRERQAFRSILEEIRSETGHDFIGYKESTLRRRIERRLQVTQTPDLGAYLEYLQANRDETPVLADELLIGVSSFFRDPEVFEALDQQVLRNLCARKPATDELRIWVPGCARGEEAYSLAILVREHLGDSHRGPRVKVFATDIDESAIAAG